MPAVRPVWFEDVEKVQRMTAGGIVRRFVEHGDGWAVRSGRRAPMTVESWPLVVLLLVVRVVSESRGKLLPVVVAAGRMQCRRKAARPLSGS